MGPGFTSTFLPAKVICLSTPSPRRFSPGGDLIGTTSKRKEEGDFLGYRQGAQANPRFILHAQETQEETRATLRCFG